MVDGHGSRDCDVGGLGDGSASDGFIAMDEEGLEGLEDGRGREPQIAPHAPTGSASLS